MVAPFGRSNGNIRLKQTSKPKASGSSFRKVLNWQKLAKKSPAKTMGGCCSREYTVSKNRSINWQKKAVATVHGAKSLGHPNPHAKQK